MPQNFPRGRSWQLLAHFENARHLVPRQLPPRQLPKLLQRRFAHPSRSVTIAFRRKTVWLCRTGTTTHAATAGCCSRTASTSSGFTFIPPTSISSFTRPVMNSRPDASKYPRSPVAKCPSINSAASLTYPLNIEAAANRHLPNFPWRQQHVRSFKSRMRMLTSPILHPTLRASNSSPTVLNVTDPISVAP